MATAATQIAGGDLTHRVPVGADGTELGRLGDALNHMLDQIEIAFRSKDDSERRLRRFVADASHELQTPVTSVRGYAELYRQGGLGAPERLASAMGRIESEGRRMGALVDDLLQLARLDEGRELAAETVDLRRICEEAAADARVVDPLRALMIFPPAGQLPPGGHAVVAGDGAQLRQVIDNLLKNIRVHTGPSDTASLVFSGDARSVELRVEDTGPGIEPAKIGLVFDRFFRADPARTRATGGSGLGLAITKSIVDAHHGTITVANRPEGGAVFTVTLPRSRTLS